MNFVDNGLKTNGVECEDKEGGGRKEEREKARSHGAVGFSFRRSEGAARVPADAQAATESSVAETTTSTLAIAMALRP